MTEKRIAAWVDGVCKTCGAYTHSCKYEAGEMVKTILDGEELAFNMSVASDDKMQYEHAKNYRKLAERLKRAAALIERLAPMWISVEERLPDTTDDVQCMCGEEGEEAEQAVGYYANSKWTLHCGLTTGYVTHWQPLPLPPQKGST